MPGDAACAGTQELTGVNVPFFTLTGTNLDAPDANKLADFYRRLLGWTVHIDEPGWVVLRPPGGGHSLNFQTEPRYVRPAWPAGPGDQQMMMHLEIRVDDLPAAMAQAVELGATVAGFQPQEDVRVCLDPAGHPFCLYTGD
ncbi:MAG: VOC family protein [Streptosporangiaceae bacterium]|nr:VOC family protein [Streptosporangiaceae bacterium]